MIPAPPEEKPGTAAGTEETPKPGNQLNDSGDTTTPGTTTDSGAVKKFQSITVKGKINDKLLFTQLGNYFILPFKDSNIEIEVSFKISSTPNLQIDESKQQYKSAKEAAKQLGLNFEEEG